MTDARAKVLRIADDLDRSTAGTNNPAIEHDIAALRAIAEALASPAQESAPAPGAVAWGCEGSTGIHFASEDRDLCVEESTRDGSRVVPLGYLAPPPADLSGVSIADLAALIVRDVCESDPADEDDPDCVRILVDDLERIVKSQLKESALSRVCAERVCVRIVEEVPGCKPHWFVTGGPFDYKDGRESPKFDKFTGAEAFCKVLGWTYAVEAFDP